VSHLPDRFLRRKLSALDPPRESRRVSRDQRNFAFAFDRAALAYLFASCAAAPNRRHQLPADLLRPLSLSLLARLLLCIPGGPKSTAELQGFLDEVAKRFEGQLEHAVEYVNKWNDRFLNKARGLLTFDGLMLAALGAVYRESHRIPGRLILAGSMCAVAAAGIILLNQFLVNFGNLNKYKDAKKEWRAGKRAEDVVNSDGSTIVKRMLSRARMEFLHQENVTVGGARCHCIGQD
jgi:hypothetical protein